MFLCSINLSAQNCPPPDDLSSKVSKLYEKATESKKNRTQDERIDMLRDVVEQQDDFGAAFEALAKLLFRKAERKKEYISECRAAIKSWGDLCTGDNDFAEINYMLGVLFYVSGEAKNAMAEFELVLSKTDNDANSGNLKSSLG